MNELKGTLTFQYYDNSKSSYQNNSCFNTHKFSDNPHHVLEALHNTVVFMKSPEADFKRIYTAGIYDISIESRSSGVLRDLKGIIFLRIEEMRKKHTHSYNIESLIPPRIKKTPKEMWKRVAYPQTYYISPYRDYCSSTEPDSKCIIISCGESNLLETFPDFFLRVGTSRYTGGIKNSLEVLSEETGLRQKCIADLFIPIDHNVMEWYKPQLKHQAQSARKNADRFLKGY